MKKIAGAILGALVGFLVGYLLFAEDLSVQQVIMGSDTGVPLFNKIGDNLMENARLKVLITTLIGLFGGLLLPGLLKGK